MEITGDQGRADHVLRWVRAIRLIYGPNLEDDRAAFTALLRGLWAVERWYRPDAAPLTWRNLQELIGSYFDVRRVPRPELPVGLQHLVSDAAYAVGESMDLYAFDLTPRHHPQRAWDPCRHAVW